MAADYQFFGANVNITLVTDASRQAKSFFVTEKQNEDAVDVMAGIDIEIEEVTESQLIQIARDHTVDLFRTDFEGTLCLVRNVVGGVFNGMTSNLQVDNVTLATSGALFLPLSIGLTWRMSPMQIQEFLQSRQSIRTLVSTDISLVGSFRIQLTRIAPQIFMNVRFVVNSSTTINMSTELGTNFGNVCQETEVRVMAEGSGHMAQLILNGNVVATQMISTSMVATRDDYTFVYGAELNGTTKRVFFEGIMRSLFITGSGGDIINIIDPSTGTNTGSEADGTVTDISQVNVIV